MLVLSIEDGIGDSVEMADNSCLYNLETDRIFCSQLVYVYSLSQLLRELHLQKHLFFCFFCIFGNWQCSAMFYSFSQPEQLHAYGLRATKGATKAFQLVVQAYILKHLMFEGKMAKKAAK